MSDSSSHERRGQPRGLHRVRMEGMHGDFELNLAPVIDCLTVLIVYTIISASFLSLGVFQTTVPSESSGQSAPGITLQVRVDLNSNHTIDLSTSGSERNSETLQAKEGDWDFATLSKKLGEFKSRSSSLNTLTLAAQSGVSYRDVVRAVEESKKVLPHIVLGE